MNKDKCKFFTGMMHKQCDAGINYDTFKGREIPCIKRYSRGYEPENAAQCDKYTEPSAEEIAKHKAEMDAALVRFTKVLPLMAKIKKEHKGKSWKGVEVCPVCGGKLHMTHSSFNGHVWGQCETKGCASWIE